MNELKHLGFILDGNRRYAKKKGLPGYMGHEEGAKKVKQILDWCNEKGIEELTLYTFSIENFKRPEEEKDRLMRLFRKAFKEIKEDKRIKDYNIRTRFIGRMNLFPEDVIKSAKELEEETKDNTGLKVNFAMGYGGRAEITDACKSIAKKVKEGVLEIEQIDEETLMRHMYLNSEPDLVIRTGGRNRTSNFLMYQSAYTEYFFSEKLLPEFDKGDFEEALRDFSERKRNIGR